MVVWDCFGGPRGLMGVMGTRMGSSSALLPVRGFARVVFMKFITNFNSKLGMDNRI